MTRACIGVCMALALQAQPPRDTRAPAPNGPAGTASIEGTVVSDEAQPKRLRRALVALSGPALPGVRVEITDDEGHFRFSGLIAAQYALAASKEPYATRVYGSSHSVSSGRGVPSGPLDLLVGDGETRSVTMRLPRGAVITGSVTDGTGQPLPGTLVRAMVDRFDVTTGSRRLQTLDFANADDRGQYRIFGLPAGQYVIYAQVPGYPYEVEEIKPAASDGRALIPANMYFPSTPDDDRASRISVAAGEERSGIDIQMQYVPTATVRGFVSGGAGSGRAAVALVRPNDPTAAAVLVGSAPVGPDGQFTFTNVAPGRYQVRTQSASSPSNGPSDRTWMWGSTDLVVDGDDVTNVAIQLIPTFTISGRIAFEGSTPPPPLVAMPLPAMIFTSLASFVPPPSMQLLDGGKFSITGLTPGVYRPNSFGAPLRGVQTPIGPWWVKSVVVDGRELLDSPLDLQQGSENAIVTLSDQASEIAGSVKDASHAPLTRGYVVVFSTDRSYWFANSRRVVASEPDARGHYSIRNLPPGQYRAAVALDLGPGEWFDPDVLQSLLATAVTVTISGSEAKTLDLTLR